MIGGDLAKAAKMSCDVIVCGGVPHGKALLRSTARAGDGIYVSGLLGGSASGLRKKRGIAWNRHLRPEPRLRLGSFLRKKRLANSCMDISDGISADLWRIARASGVAAHLDGTLPLFAGATINEALHGGEDYELLFTAPKRAKVPEEFEGIRLTKVGTIGPETTEEAVAASASEFNSIVCDNILRQVSQSAKCSMYRRLALSGKTFSANAATASASACGEPMAAIAAVPLSRAFRKIASISLSNSSSIFSWPQRKLTGV